MEIVEEVDEDGSGTIDFDGEREDVKASSKYALPSLNNAKALHRFYAPN